MVTPLGLVPPAVGLGYGLRFPDPKSSGMQDEVASERLVFEAVSRPGTGRLIFTGSGDEELQLMAHAAMEWAMVREGRRDRGGESGAGRAGAVQQAEDWCRRCRH